MVFTGSRLVPIEALRPGIEIVSLTTNWELVPRLIRCSTSERNSVPLIRLTLPGGDTLVVAADQQCFLFYDQRWTAARELHDGSALLCIGTEPCVIEHVEELTGSSTIWHIDVGEPHTFFISSWCILTHNMDCTLVMAQMAEHHQLTAALSSMGVGGLLSYLGLYGSSMSFTGGALTITIPASLPALCVAAGGGLLGYTGYRLYRRISDSASLHYARKVVDSAASIQPHITYAAHNNTNNPHTPHDPVKKYNDCNNGPKNNNQKPVITPTTEDIGIIKTVHITYRFLKRRWRECKDACHNVISELSKKGGRCRQCEGPAFRANYGHSMKHSKHIQGKISPAPIDGESAMYNSVAYKGDIRRRFGTSNNQIVEFKTSGNNPQNEYHGYAISWDNIEKRVQQFLIEYGLVDKRGRPF